MALTAEERDEFRAVIRDFLGDAPPQAPATGAVAVPVDLWRRACAEVGISGIAEPEADGGAGCGFAELAIVVEEAGRVLSPLPVLSSLVVFQGALAATGDTGIREGILPGLLDGTTTGTVAVTGDDPEAEFVVSRSATGDWELSGRVRYVLDGDSADYLIVAAATPDGPSLFLVETGTPGAAVVVPEVLDLTRKHVEFTFNGVTVRRIGEPGAADDVMAAARQLRTAAIACEQTAAADQCLSMAVAYLKERVQYGRILGSFQALKHRCADLAIAVEDARSAVHGLLEAFGDDDGAAADRAFAASVAAAVCTGTFIECAAECVHLHGGIGFTWEHPAHLYFRRANAYAALYGDVARHRDDALSAVGI